MNAEQFVDAVREVVMKPAVMDVLGGLEQPRRGNAAPEMVELSQWWHGLDDRGRKCVRMIAADASHAALFGLFCVIDGVRTIEDGPDKGRLELNFVKDGKRTVISSGVSGQGEFLHDLLNSEPRHEGLEWGSSEGGSPA